MTLPTATPEPRPHLLPAGLTASQAQALVRDQYACFRCGDHLDDPSRSMAKRARRVDAVSNYIALCAQCQMEVLANSSLSRRLGYRIPDGNFNHASIPVLHHRNGWVVLTADGKWAKADEYAVKDWEDRWPA